MGVDYLARKSSKKRKKKERQAVGKDEIAAQRERRRKKVRRLCEGVCFKVPALTEEDKRWSDNDDSAVDAPDSDVEDAIARANSHRGVSTSGASPTRNLLLATPKVESKGKGKEKKKPSTESKDGDGVGDDGGKHPTLSTSVKLLDPSILAHNARQAALRKLPPGAQTDALERFPPLLQAVMLTLHHVEPTPVQERCWPAALTSRDVQAVAEPGSGKTLAYLLPGLVKLQAEGHSGDDKPKGPAMLVLLPTRELAQQVAAQCRATRLVTGLRTVCVFGGAPYEEQAALLTSRSPHVLVATPGRVLDLVDNGDLQLQGHIRYLVLDEADKMLSLGFKTQLDRLYDMLLKPHDEAVATVAVGKKTAKKKGAPKLGAVDGVGDVSAALAKQRPQVLLFSATMPGDVTTAAAQWLRQPEQVHVGSSAANSISRTVTQVVHVCAEHKKPDKLLKHVARVRESVPAGCRNAPRVLIFANRVKTVRFLANTLAKEGYKVVQLHGQRPQVERNQAVADFRSGKTQMLVATDVAARGLDIRSLPYVVNYDFPSRLETYVHRVGRTGRLAAYGHAYSFFTRNLAPLAPSLVELLQSHDQAVDPNLASLATAWKLAEEKLGAKGAAAAAAAVVRASDGSTGDAEDVIDDDEGDGASVANGAGESLAEQVLAAADDLNEGLGPKSDRAIEGLMKKLARKDQQQREQLQNDSEGGAIQAAKKQRVADKKTTEMAVAVPSGRSKGGTGEEHCLVPLSEQQRKATQKRVEGEGRQAAFVAAKAFQGAMIGFAFRSGPQGLGYYLDLHQAAAREAPAAGRKATTAAAPATVGAPTKSGVAVATKKGAKPSSAKSSTAAAWGLPTRNKPIIPARHSDFLSGSDDSDSDVDRHRGAARDIASSSDGNLSSGSEEGKSRRRGDTAVNVCNGSRRLQGKQPVGVCGKLAGMGMQLDDDNEDRPERANDGLLEGGNQAVAKRRYKPLPGRLRKKLKGQIKGKAPEHGLRKVLGHGQEAGSGRGLIRRKQLGSRKQASK